MKIDPRGKSSLSPKRSNRCLKKNANIINIINANIYKIDILI